MAEKTIAAIASPLGEASIGVIRISGEKATDIADRIFFSYQGKKLKDLGGYRALYGEIRENGTVVDDAVALVFKAPKSYTGEDVVEISVHGGTIVVKKTLRLILDNGACLAEPGEFTKRAFLNGKTDLTRAESIIGLISARNEAQLKISKSAHNGVLSRKITEIEQNMVAAAASIAAYSDYPDEDLEGLDNENFLNMLESSHKSLSEMLSSYDAGRIIREGVDTAIVGKPNVGKSTVMNMLSGWERSIVTDIAGTTRDIVEDTVTVGDIILCLSDTAGIHETEDTVERLGVERACSKIDTAGLVLAVFDSSLPLDSDDYALLNKLNAKNTIILINKTDLDMKLDISKFSGFKTVQISAKQGTGFKELENAIAHICKTAEFDPDSAVLINERQRDCALRALKAVTAAKEALISGYTVDAVGVCVDDALAALLELSGKRVTNEVTDEIFRRFCVGK
ncbi:MAG: tRNA uridine-5-carboxymethylaminomethyl(34) synthesis GTPase MnmE [Clostridia bacterium]|nr:tRNA uridine-5-carboxymethylaminomethyl(34) synthesis GTPase MnmE [Clostridia bacterium]